VKGGRGGKHNVHIARQSLRKMLMEQVPDGHVRWAHRMTSYSETGGGVDLVLEGPGGTTVRESCDVLVGADGIWSTVRRVRLPSAQDDRRYLGCIVVLGIAPHPPGPGALLDGETVFQTADGTTRLYAMPFDRARVMWQLSFPLPEDDARALSAAGPAALRREAGRRCGGWHCPIPALLAATPEEDVSGYPVYDRPVLTAPAMAEEAASRTTLMGDAAHPMSPFKGQGANQALLDAVELARCLYEAVYHGPGQKSDKMDHNGREDRIPAALRKYERTMVERSRPKVEASSKAAQFLHSEVAVAEGNVTRGGAAAIAEELEKP